MLNMYGYRNARQTQLVKTLIKNNDKFLRENVVIIRIWMPHAARGGRPVVAHWASEKGHATLETHEIYASLWPGPRLGEEESEEESKEAQDSDNMLGRIAAGLFGSNLATLIGPPDENGITCEPYGTPQATVQPDYVIPLFSLDASKINQFFEKFEARVEKGEVYWAVCGANGFSTLTGHYAQSCAGLVYDLLNAGGIEKISTWNRTANHLIVTPDSIAQTVFLAYQREKNYYGDDLPYKGIKLPYGDLNLHTLPLIKEYFGDIKESKEEKEKKETYFLERLKQNDNHCKPHLTQAIKEKYGVK